MSKIAPDEFADVQENPWDMAATLNSKANARDNLDKDTIQHRPSTLAPQALQAKFHHKNLKKAIEKVEEMEKKG